MSRRRSVRVSLNIPFTPNNNRRRDLGASEFNIFKTPAKRPRLEHEEDVMYSGGATVYDGGESYEMFKGGVWHVHRVSQLKDFKYHHKAFKRYSRIIGEHLRTSVSDNEYTVNFIKDSSLARNDDDSPAVKIEVVDMRTGNPHLLYEGILVSSRTSDVACAEGFIHLPVLLARGKANIREGVHRTICSIFACSIHKMSFPEEEMHWMVASWSGFLTEGPRANVITFLFQTSSGKISLTRDLKSLKELWKRVKQGDEPTVNEAEVRQFHAGLYAHVERTLGFGLSRSTMVAYKTANFALYNNGEVRIRDMAFAPRILSALTDLCEFRLREIFCEED